MSNHEIRGNKNNSEDNTNNNKEEAKKEYRCTGCGTPLSIYDEKCPNCERLNPWYIYR